ncbi:hypothetical protein EDC56_2631 [Sinobacterium caligoides]|uniref:Secreted protein with PEP-CTERM sorting signal n=1 Tax=Sinobacterium caligoides TaxID=933926 RepID=A0A3N2DJP1_9GAMM|nr:hypothetical protein [Sinobacterium caligoides]ROR99996.1 hypothetical protein EDC56_2631 [Sinobacterium caligoides]
MTLTLKWTSVVSLLVATSLPISSNAIPRCSDDEPLSTNCQNDSTAFLYSTADNNHYFGSYLNAFNAFQAAGELHLSLSSVRGREQVVANLNQLAPSSALWLLGVSLLALVTIIRRN